MFGSNALITADFQLSGVVNLTQPTHIYIVKDGLNSKVRLAIQQHEAEPSLQHQAVMEINELIAFGELCITLGKLYLKDKGEI